MTVTTRDILAEQLRASFKGPICEADEWRPLADHVLKLMELTQQKSLEVRWESGTLNPVIFDKGGS